MVFDCFDHLELFVSDSAETSSGYIETKLVSQDTLEWTENELHICTNLRDRGVEDVVEILRRN